MPTTTGQAVPAPERPAGAAIASAIAASKPDILSAYRQSLSDLDSPLMRDARTREQIMFHAGQMLDELADDLAGHAGPAQRSPAADIAVSRAVKGLHPSDSLRAAAILFESVVRSVARPGGPVAGDSEALLAVALSIHRVLTRAQGTAADAYAQFQLDRIRSANVEERRRISRELHDRVGHWVSVAFRNLELYQVHRATRPQDADRRVDAATAALRETLDGVRQVISDLRVGEPLDSLEKALRQFLQFADTLDVSVQLQWTGDEHRAPPDTRDEVFLILREALRNVFAHASAHVALVRVVITSSELHATVHDDGNGFDPTAVTGAKAGLISIRERVSLLNGTVSIVSAPGEGTTIDVIVPLSGI